jgi:hypothetical protein
MLTQEQVLTAREVGSGAMNRSSLAPVAALVSLVFAVILVPALWLFLAFDHKYRQCVALRNGLNLGYEAVFDLGRPFLKPIAVPKFRDGTPLIRDDLWALYVTDTTIHGVSLAVKNADSFRFAWREDTGLIKQDEDAALYEGLLAEAGHANWDFGAGSLGTGWLLNELIKRPEFKVHRCPTALMTW